MTDLIEMQNINEADTNQVIKDLEKLCENLEKCDDDSNEDIDESGIGPTTERWAPLGADNEESSGIDNNFISYYGNESAISGHGALCTVGPANNLNPLDPNRIKCLEEEQEVLTTSLMALTSHFAQVQFRLRQIVEAPPNDRDQLLMNLEEFAFRGIPEITGNLNPNESEEVISSLERARQRQFDLIDRLKRQLSELEKFAYESGAPVLPQSILVEKQKVIIDELKNKLNLNVNETDLPQLSTDDLRHQVDTAIGEFVGPLKMKEQLVAQLKTQITDLERFIAFLQGETTEITTTDLTSNVDAYNSYAAKKKHISNTSSSGLSRDVSSMNRGTIKKPVMEGSVRKTERRDQTNIYQHYSNSNSNSDAYFLGSFTKAHNLLDKAATLLQMFAVTQFGCGSNRFQKNALKKMAKYNHYGDLRAQLEVNIQEIISLVIALKRDEKMRCSSNIEVASSNKTMSCEGYDECVDDLEEEDGSGSGSSYSETVQNLLSKSSTQSVTNAELTSVVRKNFAVSLQKLIQHGLRIEGETATNLVPFIGCLNPSTLRETHTPSSSFYYRDDDMYDTQTGTKQLHAWELIMEYYNIKNGDQYNETPARKLSQSFNLDIIGGTAISNKQSLLSAIGSIIAMHSPYKRSYNSHFKAFVCAGLNSHKLVQWLNLIFQCSELVDTYYTNWSYVAKTGFRDSLRSIDRLTKYDFDLPIDLAIRQFQNIKDVFM